MADYCILLGQVDNLDIDLSETHAVYMPPETQVANITPTTEQQKVLPDKNKYFSEVNVDAVTADIDSNIVPENIKLGATILGVQGNVAPDKPDQTKTVTPSEEEQVVRADTGYELGECIVKPIPSNYEDVTAEVQEQNGIVANLQTIMQGAGDDVYYTGDATATAETIKKGNTAYIRGGKVTGTYTPNLQEKEVTEKGVVTYDEGYEGLSKVTVNVGGSVTDVDALMAGNLFSYLTETMLEQIMTGNYILMEGE